MPFKLPSIVYENTHASTLSANLDSIKLEITIFWSIWWSKYLIILVYISTTATKTKHLFVLLVTCIFSFLNYLFTYLAHYSIRLFIFYLMICRSPLSIIKLYHLLYQLKIFLSFLFLMLFIVQNILIWLSPDPSFPSDNSFLSNLKGSYLS